MTELAKLSSKMTVEQEQSFQSPAFCSYKGIEENSKIHYLLWDLGTLVSIDGSLLVQMQSYWQR